MPKDFIDLTNLSTSTSSESESNVRSSKQTNYGPLPRRVLLILGSDAHGEVTTISWSNLRHIWPTLRNWMSLQLPGTQSITAGPVWPRANAFSHWAESQSDVQKIDVIKSKISKALDDGVPIEYGICPIWLFAFAKASQEEGFVLEIVHPSNLVDCYRINPNVAHTPYDNVWLCDPSDFMKQLNVAHYKPLKYEELTAFMQWLQRSFVKPRTGCTIPSLEEWTPLFQKHLRTTNIFEKESVVTLPTLVINSQGTSVKDIELALHAWMKTPSMQADMRILRRRGFSFAENRFIAKGTVGYGGEANTIFDFDIVNKRIIKANRNAVKKILTQPIIVQPVLEDFKEVKISMTRGYLDTDAYSLVEAKDNGEGYDIMYKTPNDNNWSSLKQFAKASCKKIQRALPRNSIHPSTFFRLDIFTTVSDGGVLAFVVNEFEMINSAHTYTMSASLPDILKARINRTTNVAMAIKHINALVVDEEEYKTYAKPYFENYINGVKQGLGIKTRHNK